MTTLTDSELGPALEGLAGWSRVNDELVREYEFETFRAAIEFVNRVADLAEAANHHPELTNVYTKVRIALTTHDAGGITQKDIALANQIDGAAATAR